MAKKMIALLCCIILMVMLLPGPVSAEEMTDEERLERIRELQQELIEINRRIAELQSTQDKAREKIATINDRIAIVEAQIELLEESIAQTEIELAETRLAYDQKVEEFDTTFALFQQQVVRDYKEMQSSSTLSLLLGATSFSDFLLNAEYTRRVANSDSELMDRLEREEQEIEQLKITIEEKLERLDADRADLDLKKAEQIQLRQEQNSVLSAAEQAEEMAVEERQEYIDEINRQNSEMDGYMGGGDPVYTGGGYAWPVPGYSWISSHFGWRTLRGQPNWHRGMDIAGGNIYGKPIIASGNGTVVRVRYDTTGYGYHIMIDHGGNQWTVYAHLSSIAVSEGKFVGQGETIGYVGSTGNSTGPHLHFEIRINGTQIDPETVVQYGKVSDPIT